MIIGVISDTHLFSRQLVLPQQVWDGMEGVDLILHAGDFCDWGVHDLLSRMAPVEAIAGNNDPQSIVEKVGRQKIIEVAGKRIGLVHGDGGFRGSTPERAFQSFTKEDQLDIIVFGHSHIPFAEYREGILLFNPGSPTDKRRQSQYSYGKIFIRQDEITFEHYYFDKEQIRD
ncbi:metallophosphoesterase family protein [Paenibacillus sp. Z6-24]